MITHSINCGGTLLDLSQPLVMGIINVTPDSFYATCGSDERQVVDTARQMLSAGAAILDVGGCSTRPGGELATEEQEMQRLDGALAALRQHFPSAIISVDTFRTAVARHVIEKHNVQIINDISFCADAAMLDLIKEKQVPYILTHSADITSSADPVAEVLRSMEQKVAQLFALGIRDVIVDPGFGFGKTLEQNYQLLRNMHVLQSLDCPVLAGISHKSMIYKLLGTTPQGTDSATEVAHLLALQHGANILRVHNVVPAMQTIKIYQQTDALSPLSVMNFVVR